MTILARPNDIIKDEYSATPTYRLSVRSDFKNKDKDSVNLARDWRSVNWSMSRLAKHLTNGFAMGVSVWRGNYRSTPNTLETNVLGLDFEHGGLTVEDLAADTFLKPFAGIIFPTTSDKPGDPRGRVIVPLSRSVTGIENRQLQHIFGALYAGKLDTVVTDTARIFYGATQRDLSRVYVNDFAVLDVDSFLAEHGHLATQFRSKSSNGNKKSGVDQSTANLDTLIAGLKPGFKPVAFHVGTEIEREVLDLLQFVARLWDTGTKPGYKLWLDVMFASHHATDGSDLVREYIANEPRFWQWDDCTGFAEWWDNDIHHETDTPVTIGTLKRYAKAADWGTYSQFDLSRVDRIVSGRYLGQALTPGELPHGQNILIKQQTGGGKTTFTFDVARQFAPKRVLYLSPYITLNYDIAGKATGKGVATDVYKDGERNVENALAATFQYVTTNGIDPAHYDLIVVEEIHQALGHLLLQSHMSIEERRAAILWLRDALRSPATVLMVDAGINQNTVDFVEMLSGNPAYIVVNEHVQPKSAIEIVDMDTALELVGSEPGKLVIATAGRKTARQLFDFANRPGILITGETSAQSHVRNFMRDVGRGAAAYDLVAYNGAMGSGVSIENTVPDTIVQIADHLGASTHLQILNRYRNQPDKVYAVHTVNARARIDEQSARQTMSRKHQAEQASLIQLLDVTAGDKGEVGKIVDTMYVRLMVEQNEQLIAPFDYYRATMERDGRQVNGQHLRAKSEAMKLIRAADRATIKAEYPNWRQGTLLDRSRDTEIEDMSRKEAIRSALHQTVRDVWRREPVMGRWSEEAVLTAAQQYHKGIGHIDRALNPRKDFAASMTIVYGENVGRSQTFLYAAVYLLLDACAYLLPDLRGKLTHEELQQKAGNFNAMIAQLEAQYNAFVERSRDHFKNIASEKRGSELALTLLNKVLGKLGINLKAINRREQVAGSREYVRDVNGAIIRDYVVEDVDMLIDILAHRHAAAAHDETSEVVADVVNTVWVRAKGRQSELPLDELNEKGLLSVWADKVQAYPKTLRRGYQGDFMGDMAFETLMEADPQAYF